MTQTAMRIGDSSTDEHPALSWRRARHADYALLHAWYLRHDAEPFVVDVCGTDADMPLDRFTAWMRDDAATWVAWHDGQPCAFLWLSYLQRRIGVADIDWRFFSSAPHPDGRGAAAFRSVLIACCEALGLTKVHLRALASQAQRLRLAAAVGFDREGVLRAQVRHAARMHDVVCLGLRLDHA